MHELDITTIWNFLQPFHQIIIIYTKKRKEKSRMAKWREREENNINTRHKKSRPSAYLYMLLACV